MIGRVLVILDSIKELHFSIECKVNGSWIGSQMAGLMTGAAAGDTGQSPDGQGSTVNFPGREIIL